MDQKIETEIVAGVLKGDRQIYALLVDEYKMASCTRGCIDVRWLRGHQGGKIRDAVLCFFALVDGIFMGNYLHFPFAGVIIIGFVATSAIMGFMLADAVKQIGLRAV